MKYPLFIDKHFFHHHAAIERMEKFKWKESKVSSQDWVPDY
jgi:hypothetical protein